MDSITVATYNMHKGMSPLNRHVHVTGMATALSVLSVDVLFLQEVQGQHSHRAIRYPNWPAPAQQDYLARHLKREAVYAPNAMHKHGHHGNALLSRFPIQKTYHRNMSVNRFEKRGLLHCVFEPAGWPQPVIALCAHLNLLARDRRKQYRDLIGYIQNDIPADVPLILAGDFNDWQEEADHHLCSTLNMHEVFSLLYGQHARSFPSLLPVLPLDRIYVRHLQATDAQVLRGQPWAKLSDHLPLTARLVPTLPINTSTPLFVSSATAETTIQPASC